MFQPSGAQAKCRRAFRYAALSFLGIATAFSQSVAIQFGQNGLSSLKQNGLELLAYGDPRLDQIQFSDSSGQPIAGDTSGSITVNPATGRVTRTSSWGAMIVDYTAAADRLNVTVTIRNDSSRSIQQIWFEPFGLRFPSRVTEDSGGIPMIVNTIGSLALQQASYTGGTLAVVAEDVQKPLQIGFPWATDGARTVFPLTLNTGRVTSLPDSYPTITRPIGPGASDTFNFSLRFGAAGTPLTTLAADMYGRYQAAYPMTLNWPDRRGIGALFVSTADTKWANNPRGYLLDPQLNVFTPAGQADLRTRILANADYAIGVLKSMNAQGMVTWDIEGQQFPHATSYVCDPRQLATLAPEMDSIADAYFKKFRDAGLKVGVCLRPQDFQLAPGGQSAQQVSVDDSLALLMDKARYAHNRWGATIFYVDSNVNATDPNPIDANIFAQLVAAFPDSLFIPEHQNLRYYAYTAPYDELRQGVTSTPDSVRMVYPNSFTTIYTADGPLTQNQPALTRAVQKGDVLMFRGWYDDPQNQIVKQIYSDAGQQAPPVVNWLSPSDGSTVNGSIALYASASSSGAIQGVQFRVDGTAVGGMITAPPYQATVDSKTLSNGSHTFTVQATDNKGATATAARLLNIQNLQPLGISITSPTQGQQVSSTIVAAAAVSNASGAASVQFQLDGANLGTVSSAPYQVTINTKTLSNGSHHLVATTTDTANRSASISRDFTVNNTVSLSCPGPGTQAFTGCYYSDVSFSTLAIARTDASINFDWGAGSPDPMIPADLFTVRWQGNFTLAAGSYQFQMTSDDGSRLWVDGQLILDDWGIHSARLNTRSITLTAGVHLIQLDYMEQYERAMVQLNWVAAATPLTVSMLSPAQGSLVSGQIHLTANASASAGVAGVQYLVNGTNAGPRLTSAPYDYVLNTAALPNGPVTISAIAYDTVGASAASAAVTATISNIPVVVPPPTVSTGDCSSGGSGSEAFLGCYYQYRDLSNFVFSRTDPAINFAWGYQTLAPGVGPENFSVRWTGDFTLQAGLYEFTMTSDDGSRLFVDGQPVMDAWYEHPAIPVTARITLPAGVHRIKMEYFQMSGNATAKLNWVKVQ